MNKLIVILAATIFGACQSEKGKEAENNLKKMEALAAQRTEISTEYQRHLQREMDWVTAPDGETKERALDSFRKLDTQYMKRLADIQSQMDSIGK